ncbi:MAG: NAD(P)-dependent oxidoreductase [Proteobacteria bacterium]|nr:NAD(P)-dependent oxidoreductase [Pseudomonadota bacterium]
MRILLTGASGFLGGVFCRELAREHEITGLCQTRPVCQPGVCSHQLDLTDARALAELLELGRFDAVIHAAALSNPNQCQEQPELSRRVNVEATTILAGLCAQANHGQGLPLCFTSTDLVFDGTGSLYAEDAPPSPVSLYGEHKVLAEEAVLTRHPEGGLVCRLPLMFGRSEPGAACFLDGFLACARRGEPLRLFEDEFRSPADAADVARGLVLMLARGARGILHLGGPERLSRLEFGQRLKDALDALGPGHNGGLNLRLEATRQADVPMAAPRPRDVSLASPRALALGYAPASVAQALPGVLAPILAAH